MDGGESTMFVDCSDTPVIQHNSIQSDHNENNHTVKGEMEEEAEEEETNSADLNNEETNLVEKERIDSNKENPKNGESEQSECDVEEVNPLEIDDDKLPVEASEDVHNNQNQQIHHTKNNGRHAFSSDSEDIDASDTDASSIKSYENIGLSENDSSAVESDGEDASSPDEEANKKSRTRLKMCLRSNTNHKDGRITYTIKNGTNDSENSNLAQYGIEDSDDEVSLCLTIKNDKLL